MNGRAELFSFAPQRQVEQALGGAGIVFDGLVRESLNLEDAFIGLTGKY